MKQALVFFTGRLRRD